MSILAGLFDRRVALAQRVVGDARIVLSEEEERFIARAPEHRRQEFVAGRASAREAMALLGIEAVALPAGADRMPIWPVGIVGSISHTDRHAVAAVARADDGFRALAVDLEPAEALPDDAWALVVRPEEETWLAAFAPARRAVLARVLFSAKESAFKAQFPLTREMLEFHDLAVTVDLGAETFTATFQRDAAPFSAGDVLCGRFRITPDLIATAVEILDATMPLGRGT